MSTITYSKHVSVFEDAKDLKENISDIVGCDCWGAYIQNEMPGDYKVANKHVYFDSIVRSASGGKGDPGRDQFYDSKFLDELVSLLDKGSILTLVIWGRQNYGDMSFFKAGSVYVMTIVHKDDDIRAQEKERQKNIQKRIDAQRNIDALPEDGSWTEEVGTDIDTDAEFIC